MSDHGPACACAQCMQRAMTRQLLEQQQSSRRLQEELERAAGIAAVYPPRSNHVAEVDPTTAAEATKAPMHLILGLPKALRALAMQLGHGARPPRAPGDWRRVPEHRQVYMAKILRHLVAYAEGHVVDESGQSHMAAVAADAMILIEREGEE